MFYIYPLYSYILILVHIRNERKFMIGTRNWCRITRFDELTVVRIMRC